MTYREIVKIAKSSGIESKTIDKDWVLGHFLNAMYSLEDIQNNFIFKGGTCLKKCYFEEYRFSEDLDFTLVDRELVIDKALVDKIITIAEQNSGAKFFLKEIKHQLHHDIPQGYEITIQFWGANHKPNQKPLPPGRWQTKIKIDISFSEKAIQKPLPKPIYHPYSDADKINNKVPVYTINEIIAEKLRALVQRNRPRDIYDLYHLSAIVSDTDHREIFDLLNNKSKSKSINWSGAEDFINERKLEKNKRAWKSSLEYHLPKGKLIDIGIAYEKVELFINRIIF